MNRHDPLRGAAARGPKPGLTGCLSLACATLALCLGVNLWPWAAGGGSGMASRFPAGQFAADLRSLVAVMRFLTEPDGDDAAPTTPLGAGLRGLALQATGRPAATFVSSSHQQEIPESLTNRPARS